jgi:hypothetical protein
MADDRVIAERQHRRIRELETRLGAAIARLASAELAAEAKGRQWAIDTLRDTARYEAHDTLRRARDPRAFVQLHHRETLALYLEAAATVARVEVLELPESKGIPYRNDGFAEHAAPQAIAVWLDRARAAVRSAERRVAWLEAVADRRRLEIAEGTWPPKPKGAGHA